MDNILSPAWEYFFRIQVRAAVVRLPSRFYTCMKLFFVYIGTESVKIINFMSWSSFPAKYSLLLYNIGKPLDQHHIPSLYLCFYMLRTKLLLLLHFLVLLLTGTRNKIKFLHVNRIQYSLNWYDYHGNGYMERFRLTDFFLQQFFYLCYVKLRYPIFI